jgi:hypothetical protein
MTDDYAEIVCSYRVAVAERRDEIVGLIVFGITDEGFLVDNVAVDPSQQGTGVGRALLEHAETAARRAGFDSVYLYTHERMTENLALYSRIGYVEYDRRVHGEACLVYLRKKLDEERDRVPGGRAAEALTARAVVLVEGISDRVALERLAQRRGRDLDAEGISIVPIGGAQAIGRFLDRFGPRGFDAKLAGLCDAAEEANFRRGLERAGLGSDLTRPELEALGFYVCVEDLEDELIRAIGTPGVEEVVEAQGELGSFRTLQKQPAWQGRPVEEQLRRFMGSGGSRKIRYARLLVDALDLTRVPRPLDGILAYV